MLVCDYLSLSVHS